MSDHDAATPPAPRPFRFRLTGPELAFAFGLAGLHPSPSADLPDLSSAPRSDAGLAAAGVLAPDGNSLTPEARAAFEVLADPTRVTVVLTNQAGDQTCSEAVLLSRLSDGPFVMCARDGETIDAALLPDRAAALVMVDDLLGISGLPAQTAGQAVDLSLPAFAALVAAADAAQEAELRAHLERRVDAPIPALTEAGLDEQMGKGRRAADTRWACGLAQLIFPADSLKGIEGHLGEGLAALESAGLAGRGAAGSVPSGPGVSLVDCLTRLVGGGSVSTGSMTAAGRVATGHLTVFRAADAIVAGTWGSIGPGAAVTVVQADRAGLLEVIDGMLEHAGEGTSAPQAVS